MKILFGGDFYPDDNFIKWFDSEPIDSNLPQLAAEHDLFIVNLEAPLTNNLHPIKKIGSVLAGNPKSVKLIPLLGINSLSLANNHILDMGALGIDDTIDLCARANINYFGAGRNLERASSPLRYDLDANTKVAILAFAEREFSAASDTYSGASVVNLIENHYQIKKEKSKNDIVIIIYHGGNEYYSLPSPELQKKCKYYIDSGADAIICHHTHVISGLEFYNGKPIFYGLGNFFFDLPEKKSKDWHIGLLVSLSFHNNSVSYDLHPIQQSWNHSSIRLLHSFEKQIVMNEIERLSVIIGDKNKLAESWDVFCEKRSNQIFSFVFGFNRIERLLLKFGIWPIWKANMKSRLQLLNAVACDSHREVLEQNLWNLMREE